jgi:alpha-ribazole phosphatase/probable phosphoglycerate mutase
MWTRVTKAVSALRARHAGQCVAFITHGGVNRILLAEALAMPSSNIFRIAQRFAAVNRIAYFDGYPVVELLNAPPISHQPKEQID